MGLDLYSPKNGVCFRQGNYSGVHRIRQIVMLLAARDLYNSQHKNRDALLDFLYQILGLEPSDGENVALDQIALKSFDSCLPIYEAFPEQPEYYPVELAGLCKFVNHSDCDGNSSPGDVEDISDFLDSLMPSLETNARAIASAEHDAEDIIKWVRGTGDFYSRACKAGSDVFFG